VIIYVLTRFTTEVPSPLVAIIVMTIIADTFQVDVRTVGEMGNNSNYLPHFLFRVVPFTFEPPQIICPYSIAFAFVRLMESLLTAQII
ncbi:UNVERIFIED_CONTAM: sodium-independent anion transporter, partial [Bacillus subtilis]